ncbi:ComEC/Rec2 family competence protein, partial [Akkermansiaceae bacterium]|nr:ComEC/Rec2 family competence protein [Akkermansiaceae bacterium]
SNHKKVGFSWGSGVWKYAEQARAFIKKSTSQGIENDSDAVSVIHAMTLGETPSSTSDITKAFRFSGAMHVFAVSGLHVTIIGGIVWGVLMVLGVQRRQAILSILMVMFGYALVTGGNPPAIRASLMATAVLSAFLLKRRPSLFNSLSLSMILVLLWNPAQVYEIGFQLSYAVISAIALGYQAAYEWTGKIAQLDPFLPRRLLSGRQKFFLNTRGKIAAILATSLAAWLGSLPWMIHHFGLITPVSVLASVLLIPLTFLVLALSFLSSSLALFSTTASSGVNHLNSVVAHMAFLSAKGFSKVPLGHYVIGDRAPADWVVYDFADGGSSSFLASGDGLLIDCGSERKYRQIVRSGLRRWTSDPGTVIYTHPDGKHSGALNSFEEDFLPARTILPVVWSRSPSFREFVSKEDFGHRGIEVGQDGERFLISDEVTLEVIRKGAERLDTLSDSRGMAFKVHWLGWKILVMGDLGVEEERSLLEKKIDVSADVVMIGQHGRTYSGSIEFLQATGAKVVIKSAATFPSKELPRERWLAACEEFGIEVFNQRDTGAVFMDFDPKQLCVKSYLQEDRLFIIEKD